jgi:hypothetical protein
MNTRPLLTIHVHTLDSHVTRFIQNDQNAVQHILEQIHPGRLFQHNLVLQDERSTSIFPQTALVRIDLIMDRYPDWPFHNNCIRATELTEEMFRERSHQAFVTGLRNTHPLPGEIITVFADLTLANADRVYAQYEIQAQGTTPADVGMMVQHFSMEPIQHLLRHGGGAVLINSAHIMRLNLYPGLLPIPCAWPATLL